MTPEQIQELAKQLNHTTQNVYRVAEVYFQTTVGEEIFTQLREQTGIFKCEECDTWQEVGFESDFRPDCCTECEDN